MVNIPTKFLYIFRPANNWGYCGGTIIISAKHYKDCAEVFAQNNTDRNETPKFFKNDEEASMEEFDWDNWVLEEVIQEYDKIIPPRIVMINYNYA